jgi:hypothetical protein
MKEHDSRDLDGPIRPATVALGLPRQEDVMAAVMYGPAIQEAAASGDLARMKAVARQAEEHLRETGDVSAALEALKLEIAKLQAKHR